jgi:hypothetical protein
MISFHRGRDEGASKVIQAIQDANQSAGAKLRILQTAICGPSQILKNLKNNFWLYFFPRLYCGHSSCGDFLETLRTDVLGAILDHLNTIFVHKP